MAALLADAGHTVVGVDPNPQTRDAMNNGRAPIDEPGLDRLIERIYREDRDRLVATSDYAMAVDSTDIAMIVVPTPSLPTGGFNPKMVVDAVSDIGARLKESERPTPYLVVVCSTLSPGTMVAEVAPALEKASELTIGEGVLVSYQPEFIALGTVIADMSAPDMVLIGSQDARSAAATAAISASFRAPTAVHRMTFTEAEVSKLATNAFLSVKISFANMIGAAVERLGGDPHVVLEAVGADSRIGRSYLKKGGNPSGPCLPRDLLALEALGKKIHAPMPLAAAARKAAVQVVDDVWDAAMAKFPPHAGGNYRVAVLGVAYKPSSPVTDDSLGRSIIQRASLRGVQVSVYDPHAELPSSFPFQHRRCSTLDEAIRDAPVVIVACPHPEFDGIDLGPRKVVNPWA